ncbi:hypothetical protein [Mycoplasmopsis columboralis]|uniref:Uncharacterized protein n=1 Tax=Mycoplasmopsis columboralis TaxID=171282 RepID=A0A449B5J5_9BACT|nr:hypothetical protein [Mycoplasmopsis columboralis]VEU75877.1 Uncharacterised protein [Mycoplasmopsis columboralis]
MQEMVLAFLIVGASLHYYWSFIFRNVAIVNQALRFLNLKIKALKKVNTTPTINREIQQGWMQLSKTFSSKKKTLFAIFWSLSLINIAVILYCILALQGIIWEQISVKEIYIAAIVIVSLELIYLIVKPFYYVSIVKSINADLENKQKLSIEEKDFFHFNANENAINEKELVLKVDNFFPCALSYKNIQAIAQLPQDEITLMSLLVTDLDKLSNNKYFKNTNYQGFVSKIQQLKQR